MDAQIGRQPPGQSVYVLSWFEPASTTHPSLIGSRRALHEDRGTRWSLGSRHG